MSNPDNTNFAPISSEGNSYVKTYWNFDLEEADMKIQLKKIATSFAYAINVKENGVFETTETLNGQQFNNPASQGTNPNAVQPQKRFIYRKIFYFTGATPAVIPHGLAVNFSNTSSPIWQFVHIYGVLNTSTKNLPLPYVDIVAANQIGVTVDATNINFIIGGTAPTITGGMVVLEYSKY